jgi:ribonucrease Y
MDWDALGGENVSRWADFSAKIRIAFRGVTLDSREGPANAGRVLPFALAAVVFFVGAFVLARRKEVERRRREADAAASEARAIIETARAASAAERSAAEAESRSKLLELKRTAHEEASRQERELQRREDELGRRSGEFSVGEQRVIARAAAVESREQALRAAEARRRQLEEDRKRVEEEALAALERSAGEQRADVRGRLVNEWVEEAKADAADRVRRVEQGLNDVEHGREAKRVMGIAIQRYQGHYLTERLLSNLPLVPGSAPRIAGTDNANLAVLEEVANIKLTLADDGAAIRLEGQDSFGREIARRAIHRWGKNGVKNGDAQKQALAIKEELEREVFDLGKRAFKELEIPRSHPDIVRLVGRLNWRTSYTQNQWKHAIEAAFLCGMMASELGLDVKLARRAALMHDIGKALTHAIDGSHAVIGADYARRLGEPEVVANAIGAHHLEEPMNTVYASLVAAADAMSGARPGARRQQDDNYAERLEALERIGGRFSGVERAFAVQGGREVRVYVQEDRVTDERAVELSSEIARQISDELTFPGQIKVTVIREVRAVEIAG